MLRMHPFHLVFATIRGLNVTTSVSARTPIRRIMFSAFWTLFWLLDFSSICCGRSRLNDTMSLDPASWAEFSRGWAWLRLYSKQRNLSYIVFKFYCWMMILIFLSNLFVPWIPRFALRMPKPCNVFSWSMGREVGTPAVEHGWSLFLEEE